MDPQEKRVYFHHLRRNDESSDEGGARVEPRSEEDSDASQITTVAPLLTNHFTILKEAVILILSVFYVVDLALDIWVAVEFFASKQPKNAWFVVFCILLPNLYAGYKSLQWYLRAHDLDPIREPFLWIIRVSFFPVSLLLRYYDTREFGRGSREARRCHDRKEERRLFSAFLIEAAEASMLRLYTIFLEDAPIAILNLKEIILTSLAVPQNEMRMLLVVLFKLIFTMTFSVLHYITSTKAVYHAAKSEQYLLMGSQWMHKGGKEHWRERGFLSLPAEIFIYMWHLCAIASRLAAYAAFVTVYQRYLWILIGIRWLLNTALIKLDARDIALTRCVAFGGVCLFSFVSTSPKPQVLRILLHYAITLTENILIAVLISKPLADNPYIPGVYGFIFGGTFLSFVFMSVYYGFFHPRKTQLKIIEWYRNRKTDAV